MYTWPRKSQRPFTSWSHAVSTSVAFALPPAVADLGDVRCRSGEYKGHVRLADATVSGAGALP